MPLDNGLPSSFRTVLYARGFKPATCCALRTSCSETSWRRLNRADLTETRVLNAPSEVAGGVQLREGLEGEGHLQ
jgi:hypothetical protein